MNASERLVVDASVVVKWYVPEPGHDKAASLLVPGRVLLAPDLLLAEVGNIIWKKVWREEVTKAEGEEIIDALTSVPPVALVAARPYLTAAFDLALAHRRTVYDALYVALAVTEGCRLVTADERLAHALAGTIVEPYIQVLATL